MTSMPDLVVTIMGEYAASERRITPAWTLAQLRAKLEPITGVPPSFQRLTLKLPGRLANQQPIQIKAEDEESITLAHFPFQNYAELHVTDTRPQSARPNFTDDSLVEKYVMPEEEYSARTDSVLAWKRREKLGRFNPNAEAESAADTARRVTQQKEDINERKIVVGARCRILSPGEALQTAGECSANSSDRRGTVGYVGPVPDLPGAGFWIGVCLDEPVGKNDGVVGGKRYFTAGNNHGSFVRPERVQVGHFLEKSFEEEEDMEEI